jgi:hydrogenase maturation protein HypF
MLLESVISRNVNDDYPFQIMGNQPMLIDLRPMVAKVVQDLTTGTSVGVVAARFHNTVAAFLVESALRAREQTRLNTVALSGGCFANRYLSVRLSEKLMDRGFEVLQHRDVPCNDGGIALGQAVVAAARVQHRRNQLPLGAANKKEKE